jgi:hypothetical protein
VSCADGATGDASHTLVYETNIGFAAVRRAFAGLGAQVALIAHSWRSAVEDAMRRVADEQRYVSQ